LSDIKLNNAYEYRNKVSKRIRKNFQINDNLRKIIDGKYFYFEILYNNLIILNKNSRWNGIKQI
jgi:hypothetical protein